MEQQTDPHGNGALVLLDGQRVPRRIPMDSVRPCVDSPRLAGEDLDHVRVLAESGVELPPIIVHRQSMRVIDGMHRFRAAMMRGQSEIMAVFYEGEDHDAFVLAVQANVAHGLPLSLTERSQAAARIINTHPQWSDRMIASVAGVAPRTVAAIRRRLPQADARSATRIGRDGRVRPVSSAAGRMLAGELLASTPQASLRQIAKAAGVAPSTVLDVRERMRTGRDILPEGVRSGRVRESAARPQEPTRDFMPTLEVLRRDPSLRFSDAGRTLLRWLDQCPSSSADQVKMIDSVPGHCRSAVVAMARARARTWEEFAVRLERRGGLASGRDASG
ncbi:ParB/RepB/Spo0J family partition protein [Allokutzneria sp. A3M-2-11 16]|uniref:ParB/RepB/Spo0J family partition protein n=1 Tax=Allokutzneria sp. A3M-2-11 16 TaxID=2962043 RepID=UPI0020B81F66|nr:ParB/RepB/Spo0J family partition protein [Allokutzneria sp. A3M-2-11 16]MCP3805539.1 ParB/RepB/Spo0J family partition protein [Allokutzneria sp. A3M-2-11 16]